MVYFENGMLHGYKKRTRRFFMYWKGTDLQDTLLGEKSKIQTSVRYVL